jgi:hypothetical protein
VPLGSDAGGSQVCRTAGQEETAAGRRSFVSLDCSFKAYLSNLISKEETAAGRSVISLTLPVKNCLSNLKGQSHEKVGEMSVWGISLGPN